MKSKQDVLDVIRQVIVDLNDHNDQALPEEPETELIGYNSQLDSLGLIILIVAIEQAVDKVFNIKITIADDKAMSQKHSPFKTIDSLTDYVLGLVNEKER